MVYQWKSNARIKASADVAGAMCEQLENTVGLTAETLLEANRDEGTPLHDEFEWDDSKAAEEYRLTQARYMIRMLCVKPEIEEEQQTPLRAFFKVSETSEYENIGVIIRNKDKRSQLLEAAFRELEAFQRKYDMLVELQPIFKKIKEIRDEGPA